MEEFRSVWIEEENKDGPPSRQAGKLKTIKKTVKADEDETEDENGEPQPTPKKCKRKQVDDGDVHSNSNVQPQPKDKAPQIPK